MKRKTPGRELTWVGGSAKEPVLEASKMLPKSGDSAISNLPGGQDSGHDQHEGEHQQASVPNAIDARALGRG